MKTIVAFASVAALTLLGGGQPARAEMVAAAPNESLLFGASTLISVPNVKVTPLTITGAGTLQIVLADLKWPEIAKTLSFALSDSSRILTKLDGPGVLSFDITGPTTLFASVYAAPGATAKAALYHLELKFVAAGPVVPLPAAVWLLISGLGGLFAVTRRSRKAGHTTVIHA